MNLHWPQYVVLTTLILHIIAAGIYNGFPVKISVWRRIAQCVALSWLLYAGNFFTQP